MALQGLTEEQVRDWTLEQKDVWWLENVYQGDMPQLTLRSALTGMMLGGVLSLTNLYVGAKTGWTLGVGITSVILAFGLFKVLSNLRLAREFTVLENNCMQSIATSAGYMTAPLISSLSAYMMVNNVVIPISTTLAWVVVLAILGVLFAFPKCLSMFLGALAFWAAERSSRDNSWLRRVVVENQEPLCAGLIAGGALTGIALMCLETFVLK